MAGISSARGGGRVRPVRETEVGPVRVQGSARAGGAGWACGGGSGRRRVQPAAVVARRASWLRRRPGKAVTFALTLAAQRSEQKRLDRLVLASMKTPWQAPPPQVPTRPAPIERPIPATPLPPRPPYFPPVLPLPPTH